MQNDYTIQIRGQRYQIECSAIVPGLRGAAVRVERRLDRLLAVRFRERYVAVQACAERPPVQPTPRKPTSTRRAQPPSAAMRAPMKRLLAPPGPPVWVAAKIDRTRTRDELD